MTVLQAVRALVVFTLGVLIIVDALLGRDDVVPKLLVGMVMVGVLPLDTLLAQRDPPPP
jgi:hypothetical protein